MFVYFLIAAATAALIWLASYLERRFDFRYQKLVTYALYALSIIIFCFFAGARGLSVGDDTTIYGTGSFEAATTMDFASFYLESRYSSWAPLMKVAVWTSAHLTNSFFWYLCMFQLLTIPFVHIACRMVLKEKAFLGILIFGILFYPMTLNFMRQFISIGLILLSYVFIRNHKPALFVLFVVVAALFHESSLVAILVYPVWLLGHWSKGSMALKTSVLAALTAIAIPTFLPIMSLIFPSTAYYSVYISGSAANSSSGYGVTSGIVISCLVLGLLYYYLLGKQDPQRTRNPELSGLAYLVFFGGAVFSLCLVSEALFRLGFYFLIYCILLLPMVLEHLKPKRSKAIFGAAFLIMISGYSVCYYAIGHIHSLVPYVCGL